MHSDNSDIQVACFTLDDNIYAVDIMRIREIIKPQKLTSLPKAPPYVEGVINLRGSVIPVIDLRKRFDLPVREIDSAVRLLIVRVAKQLLGFVVDNVTEVITVPARDIKPPPQIAGGIGAQYLLGVCLFQEALIMLLNIDTIFTDREASELGLIGSMHGEG
ncbi:scaffold protein CheW associated with MCPs of class 40H [Geotalea daltonii FRC-32]|uniref:Scaffold protein CheW associated with MCPs of class 40H n=1 Tax=Geotalea daltonii (strain DSM 22248 / JCM 15807 / FRC-32) TaxID=316067 RepID=B9M9E5_GEODF|nr:chemotaxis protein CheW [Geotalea daltonii]ACM20517.1 scaffold protein CheW associated with MCPs of class 40H [Geotalea daltonii FRC-32]